jgi:hypothetical protein
MITYSNLSICTPRRKLVRSADENGKASALQPRVSFGLLHEVHFRHAGTIQPRDDQFANQSRILSGQFVSRFGSFSMAACLSPRKGIVGVRAEATPPGNAEVETHSVLRPVAIGSARYCAATMPTMVWPGNHPPMKWRRTLQRCSQKAGYSCRAS